MNFSTLTTLEDWTTEDEIVGELSDALHELSTKDYVALFLLSELVSAVERRTLLWQQLQAAGFTSREQAAIAYLKRNHELSKEA
ncbi:MAG: hypothetical protein IJ774_12440 [Selenomonadaceae bacterium]|nr:hypothetical protein [Selenomonadaceae bacterium]